jgi:hypothetical protein
VTTYYPQNEREEQMCSREQDADIPVETRRELMHCATQNGRISYWYLCDLWRRGRRAGRNEGTETRRLLAVAAPEFCSNRCPSVFRKPYDPRHVDDCNAMRATLELPPAPDAVDPQDGTSNA